ncbi:NAD(P)H-quinone oxidoreductase [Colwellia sp. MEBiC06753]
MKYIDVIDDQLHFAETESPKPASNQCLIKVKAIGINRADLLQRAGKYPPPKGESPILGLEVAGEVVESSDPRFPVGECVCGLVAGGGYAEFAVVNTDQLIKLPEFYSFEMGAALTEVFLTAYQALFSIGQIKPNTKVLIHAGASGVGSAAIQLAKAHGCYVVATAGSDEKVAACLSFGADQAINYKQQDFVQCSSQQSSIQQNMRFDFILDVVAGDYLAKNIELANLDATIVILAMLGGRFASDIDIAKLLQKRITVTASTLRNRSDSYKAELTASFTRDFYHHLVAQQIKPIIDSSYSWQQAELAHQRMANNDNIGKLVLTVD